MKEQLVKIQQDLILSGTDYCCSLLWQTCINSFVFCHHAGHANGTGMPYAG